MSVVERMYVCTRTVSEDDVSAEKEAIVSDFSNLVFENFPCSDSSNINYNDGKEVDPFDKIAKYYGRQKNVFQFISLLRNPEFSALILNKIRGKCSTEQFESFIERVALYLIRIKQGEITAKEFLNGDHFPGAFFNGYHCGEKKNFHENLNVNFTQSTQFLDVHDIFIRKIDCRESGELLRVKIFENGLRAVTVENDQDVRKYSFSQNAACQLVLKSEKSSLYLDIIAGRVANVEREVGDIRATLTKVSEISDELLNYSEILINLQSLKEVLLAYFDEKCMLDKRDWFVQEQCLPIKTFEDLENWKPAEHQHVTERLLKRKKVDGPKTLVCHDMEGGYLDDRYVYGTKNINNSADVHWQHVDTFVYFSHHFVTIPPCTWISAAHRNGVRVLGTFITEWNDGEQLCNKFLKDEKSALELASRLVNIAKLCNFEGWLIRIGNTLMPHQIPVLKKFLSFLTSKMSSFSSDSQVIWYDSVIKNGELKWQNALNENNRMFFNACDGIFLNFKWKEEDLAESLKSAAERQTDVYVGVDVLGRGCLGGGGFSTDVKTVKKESESDNDDDCGGEDSSGSGSGSDDSVVITPNDAAAGDDDAADDDDDAADDDDDAADDDDDAADDDDDENVDEDYDDEIKAVAEARKFGLSVAIFAPGWVHDCDYEENFEENQLKFWAALRKYCPARTITEFPRTTFCAGFGWEMHRNGKEISDESWHNLGLQSLQPIYSWTENASFDYWGGCNGGCSIVWEKGILSGGEDESLMLKLFETDLNINGELIVSYTCYEFVEGSISLVLQLKNGSQLHLVGKDENVSNMDEYCFPSSKEELLKKGYNKEEGDSEGWTTRTYLLNRSEENIQSISVILPPLKSKYYRYLLGKLEMIPLWPNYNLVHRNLTCNWDAAKTSVKVQCVLEWQYQTSVLYSDLYVEVPGEEKKYLGTTSQLNFKLDYDFDNIDFFNVVLCPQGALKEDLGSETMRVNIV